jgi:hypothetical protein
MNTVSEIDQAQDAKARRAAKRAHLVARRSRWRCDTVDNRGGFMLIDERNLVVAGERFDLSAEDVITFCRDRRSQEEAA